MAKPTRKPPSRPEQSVRAASVEMKKGRERKGGAGAKGGEGVRWSGTLMHHPATTPAPRARIHELGVAMRTSLAAIVTRVGNGNSALRPVALSKALRVDDSLAARILRSIRAGDPLSSLRELPAPQGLRLFLEAAGRAGVPATLRAPADEAVKQLEELLAELPLGRASLNTAIDGWLPSGRAHAERSGKQAVFKAFSQTMGFTVDTTCFALAIQPSAAGDTCDSMTFVAMDGIRRLREGAPILLFGHVWPQREAPGDGSPAHPTPYVETLDGEREVTDARKLILRGVGDSATLPFRMVERGTHTRVVLDSSAPPLNVPVTAAVSYISRNAYTRFQTREKKSDVFLNAAKVPIRVLVQDLFIHEDAYPQFVPNVTARMDALSHDPSDRDPELLELDRLDLDIDLVRLGWGLDRVGVKEWGGYEPALRDSFARAGWNPAKFRAFRCYVRYPLPYVSMTTWFDLPVRP